MTTDIPTDNWFSLVAVSTLPNAPLPRPCMVALWCLPIIDRRVFRILESRVIQGLYARFLVQQYSFSPVIGF